MRNPFKTKEEAVPFDANDERWHPTRLTCIGIAAIAIACVAVLGISLFEPIGSSSETLTVSHADSQGEDDSPVHEKQIYVHLLGCVAHPGVYQCAEGSRVADVVDLAGGLLPEAAPQSINLAAQASDGSQLTVLSQSEFESQTNPVSSTQETVSTSAGRGGGVQGLININTASASELQTLNGIGQATAEKIISYRQKNGSFSSIEDLTNVSGIGEKRLEAIRDLITV